MDIKLLLKERLSQREIARRTGLSRNTVARLAAQSHPRPFSRPATPSLLDPYKPYLLRRRAEVPLSAVRLLEEIRPMGYRGGLHVLRRFLAAHRAEEQAHAKVTGAVTPISSGWTHSYNVYLEGVGTGSVTVVDGDGSRRTYDQDFTGAYIPPAGTYDSLVDNGNGTFTFPD